MSSAGLLCPLWGLSPHFHRARAFQDPRATRNVSAPSHSLFCWVCDSIEPPKHNATKPFSQPRKILLGFAYFPLATSPFWPTLFSNFAHESTQGIASTNRKAVVFQPFREEKKIKSQPTSNPPACCKLLKCACYRQYLSENPLEATSVLLKVKG